MIILKSLLLIFLIATAYLAITFKEELISIIFLSIFSITLTTLYLIHNAPDVALAEAVIGAGLNTAIFMTVISQVREGKSIFREDD
jgi:multicomponent Na+:H+ antiporter subunit B